jgi:haloalkane dehalogenase/tRNA(adenine34) deaminase
VPDRPDAGGAALSRQARDFWRERWTGKSLMAIGMKDPVLGPPVMQALHGVIRNCPPPLEIADGGHFLQEWGEEIAHSAVKAL